MEYHKGRSLMMLLSASLPCFLKKVWPYLGKGIKGSKKAVFTQSIIRELSLKRQTAWSWDRLLFNGISIKIDAMRLRSAVAGLVNSVFINVKAKMATRAHWINMDIHGYTFYQSQISINSFWISAKKQVKIQQIQLHRKKKDTGMTSWSYSRIR